MVAASASATPLYGTCNMSVRVRLVNKTPERCSEAPVPAEPYCSGVFFAYSINSRIDLAGISGLTTSTNGTVPIRLIDAKSLLKLNLTLGYTEVATSSCEVNIIHV